MQLAQRSNDDPSTRMTRFVTAVKNKKFGRAYGLQHKVDELVTVSDQLVCVNVRQCSDKQKEYLIKVASNLGYTPFWLCSVEQLPW